MLKTAMRYSHDLLKEVVQPGDQVIDATMGNGYDTVYLAELVGESGVVYSFDVQPQALQTTAEKLTAAGLTDRTFLLLNGHETIPEYVPVDQPIKAAIFNLGYLPHSDKSIITLPTTTKKAMEAILERLAPKGRMVLVVYYGHEGGIEEKNMVIDFCKNLPQKEFNVLSYQFINQRNNPPILICVEKK